MYTASPGGMSSAISRAVVVFARAPLAGEVKTRLAAALGDAEALRIYRDMGRRAVAAARSARDCRVVIAYTPASRAREVRDWLGEDLTLVPQHGQGLGERMLAAVRTQMAAGVARVAVIGTDCPELTGSLIDEALDVLDRADAVFGPARDGGYYLVALGRAIPELFTGVSWSSPDTLSRTLELADAASLRVELLRELEDIDTADDWERWRARQRVDSVASEGS